MKGDLWVGLYCVSLKSTNNTSTIWTAYINHARKVYRSYIYVYTVCIVDLFNKTKKLDVCQTANIVDVVNVYLVLTWDINQFNTVYVYGMCIILWFTWSTRMQYNWFICVQVFVYFTLLFKVRTIAILFACMYTLNTRTRELNPHTESTGTILRFRNIVE